MLKKRRGLRQRVVVGTALVVGLVLFMIVDSRHKEALQVQGPTPPAAALGDALQPNAPNHIAPQAPRADGVPQGSAVVRVTVPKGQKELWVDDNAIKIDTSLTLDLAPGRHVLMVRSDARTLMQKVFLNPNDVYHVSFSDTVRVEQQK